VFGALAGVAYVHFDGDRYIWKPAQQQALDWWHFYRQQVKTK